MDDERRSPCSRATASRSPTTTSVALLGTAQPRQGLLLAEMLGEPAEQGPQLSADLHDLVMDEIDHGVDADARRARVSSRACAMTGLTLGLASNSPSRVRRGRGRRGRRDRRPLRRDPVGPGRRAPQARAGPLSRARARLGVDPRECVALEDSPTGVAAARAAGAFTIGVPSFPGVTLDDADLVCTSLDGPARRRQALGRESEPGSSVRLAVHVLADSSLNTFFKGVDQFFSSLAALSWGYLLLGLHVPRLQSRAALAGRVQRPARRLPGRALPVAADLRRLRRRCRLQRRRPGSRRRHHQVVPVPQLDPQLELPGGRRRA